MRFFLLLLSFLGSVSTGFAQADGDYRTAQTGDWNTPATWQVRSGGTWATAAAKPGTSNAVYLQAGHSVTLTGNESCNNFHISVNSTGTRLNLGSNTLSISGKMRAMADAAATTNTTDGTIPGTSTMALPGVATWIKSAAGGGFTITGTTRDVTTAGEWEAGNSGTVAPNGFDLIIAPPADETFTFGTPLKARSITINGAGTVDMGTNRLAPDAGPAGSGDLTINGTLKSAGINSTSNAVVGRLETGADRYSGTVTLNGTLFLTGSSPTINAAIVVLGGTVVYGRTGNQNFLGGAVAGSAAVSTYTTVTVAGGGTKTLVVPTTVTGALTLTLGRIVSSTTNLLILGDTATVPTASSSSAFVSGPVQKKGSSAFVFPVGKGSSSRPVTLSASAAATAAYTVEYFNTPYPVRTRNSANPVPLQHISGKEYWIISRNAGSSTPNITLSFTGASGISPGGLTNLVLAHFNGTNWNNLGQVSTTGAASTGGTLTGSTASLTNFSPFTFGTTDAAQPLPISLLHFSGAPLSGTALRLRWSVSAEEEGCSYSIEKALAGEVFKTIGAVRGKRSERGEYTFTDGDFGAGKQLYRLAITNAGGGVQWSETLSFAGKRNTSAQPVLYPNPVGNFLNMQGLVPGVEYTIRSAEGRIYQRFKATGSTGLIGVEDLPAGTYILEWGIGTGVRFVH